MPQFPMEASSPIISEVTSVPMAFMIMRAPPGCRLAKEDTSKTAASKITHLRPFKIWMPVQTGGGGGEGGGGV